jgi:hypothetical protein
MLPKFIKTLDFKKCYYNLPKIISIHNFHKIDTIKCEGWLFNEFFHLVVMNNINLNKMIVYSMDVDNKECSEMKLKILNNSNIR